MNRYIVAALSTVFATLTGLLINVFTNGWSVPVGVGLAVLVVLWVVYEGRAKKQASNGEGNTGGTSTGGGAVEEILDPGAQRDVRPGTPAIWNVPSHNHEFTGRDGTLADLRNRLNPVGKQRPQPVQVLRGIAGVGKTQLVTEYAWRNESDYDIVWWINSEDETLIGEQLAALAIELGLVGPGAAMLTAANMAKDKLRKSQRWLLIFDNAENPEAIRKLLPGGAGHVLITSRSPGWETIGHTTNVTPMEREESVALLRAHDHDLVVAEAKQLADKLGDLPLALVSAGTYLAGTGISVREYLDELRNSTSVLHQEGLTGEYPHSVAATVLLSIQRLQQSDPVGLAIVRLGAFFAPESIPTRWLTKVDSSRIPPAEVVAPLAQASATPLLIANAVKAANQFGLITVTHQGFLLHRLHQAVVRDQLDEPADQDAFRAYARAALVSHPPGDPEDPRNWADWARMVPHLLAVEPALGTDENWCRFACDASWYMIERGDSVAAAMLAKDLRNKWIRSLGRDHPMTLLATRCLARAMRENGDWAEAKEIYSDALERLTRVLGPLHENTLRLQHGGAINLHLLGEYEAALKQQTDAWEKYKQVKNEKFLHTLHAANHAANALRELNRAQEARDWHQQTLSLYQETVGPDNPDTMRCASNLALDLRALGHFEEARALQEETLGRRRKVLGENNRYTLQSAADLGATLFELDQFGRARDQLEKTLAKCRTFLGADHVETLRCAASLAQTLHALGSYATAQPLASDTYLRYGRSSLKASHPDALRAGEIFASILSSVGQQGEAELLRQRLADAKAKDTSDQANTGEG